MRGTTRDMSDRHEMHLVARLGGRRTAGSGNQFNNPMDGRHNRYETEFAFAWDGKSTLGKSIGVSQEMWEKAQEQALGERPALALRWYHDERLTSFTDLMAISLDDFEEMLARANEARLLRACMIEGHPDSDADVCPRCGLDVEDAD